MMSRSEEGVRPSNLYRIANSNVDNVQRKFLLFYSLHKAENTFHKENSSGEFHIFTNTPKCEYSEGKENLTKKESLESDKVSLFGCCVIG